MVERDQRIELQEEQRRQERAIRGIERRMAEEEREMERAMRAFEADEERAVARIKDQWRREHWGRDLERRPRLPDPAHTRAGDRGSGARRGPSR